MDLDSIAAQAVLQARLLERAVNDPGPWVMTCGDQSVAASRFRKDSGISFLADFPEGISDDLVALSCDGIVLGVRPVSRDEVASTVRWDVEAHLVGSRS